MGKVSTVTVLLIAVWAFAPLGVAHAAHNQSKTPTGVSQSKATPGASGYVGSEVCQSCHTDIYNNWEKTPHWKTTLDAKGGPSHQGCEACHGPGEAHVAGG